MPMMCGSTPKMTNGLDPSSLAVSWLQRQAQRGVTASIADNGHIALYPASGRATMSDVDATFMRMHREAIKQAITSGEWLDGVVDAIRATQPTPTKRIDAPPAPVECGYCRGPLDRCEAWRRDRPDIWRATHSTHPDEIERLKELDRLRYSATLQGWRLMGIERPNYR
jgi:hypothetical protein